ncbi:MAG: hypothetical protein IM488_18255 [Microcystis sp. M025S2]|uniref:hypothetical protein n=1 Tax=Microcystis sp. M025S2 TaxID=2771161 RepID=UPI002586A54D|nr:hypothetical protein [Microcystis sp. M025S2]MCA2711271.1 hypothetical protein [Microcystis sp. M025S2]
MSISGSRAGVGVTKAEFNPVKNDVTQLKSDIIAVNGRIDVLGGTTNYDALSAQINANQQGISSLNTSVSGLNTSVNSLNEAIVNNDLTYYFIFRQISNEMTISTRPRTNTSLVTKLALGVNTGYGVLNLIYIDGASRKVILGGAGTGATIVNYGDTYFEGVCYGATPEEPVSISRIKLSGAIASNMEGEIDYLNGYLHYHNGSQRIQLQNKITTSDNLAVNSLTASSLSSSGSTLVGGGLTVNGSSTLNGTTINSTLSVTGNTTLGNTTLSNLTSTGTTNLVNLNSTGSTNLNTLTSTGNVNLTNILYTSTNGRVGVGTSTPQFTFHVNGSLKGNDGVVVGDSQNHAIGKLRYTGTKLQISDGNNWNDVNAAGMTSDISISGNLNARNVIAYEEVYGETVQGILRPIAATISQVDALTGLSSTIFSNPSDNTIWYRENTISRPLRSHTPRFGQIVLYIYYDPIGNYFWARIDSSDGWATRLQLPFEEDPWRIRFLTPKDIPNWDKSKCKFTITAIVPSYLGSQPYHTLTGFDMVLIDEDGDYKKLRIRPYEIVGSGGGASVYHSNQTTKNILFGNNEHCLRLEFNVADYNYY